MLGGHTQVCSSFKLIREIKVVNRQIVPNLNVFTIFAERPEIGEDGVLDSLKRLVSGVLTHPVTIGKIVNQYTPKRKKNSPKSVHLVGTDRPEATMIYAGFYNEILASNALNPIKLTLVSPDEANQQLANDCSPANPMLINPRCKLTAWDGLYHDFWDKYINRKRVEEPDLVMGIHPGLHADGIYEFWEPTLELLLDKEIVTCFTVLDKEEFQSSLIRLDALFCRYLYKGINTFASNHVKQTPHDADLMWASNMYLIVFQVTFHGFFFLTFSKLELLFLFRAEL